MPSMGEAVPSWAALRSFMNQRCGVQLAEDQRYLMDARLALVAKTLNFASVDDYVLTACRPGATDTVTAPLIDAMTTHETSFFRDGVFWKALADLVLPRVVTPGLPLRIWSAACSTGQEPYTLAMLIHERFPQLAERTSIVATDISEGSLATARAGSFSVFEVNRGVTGPRLVRFFERDGLNFRVKAPLRNMISWAPHNLVTQSPPGAQFDLVLVRNVLIYFSEATRTQVLTKIRQALRPNGCFAIGTSELISPSWGTSLAQGWYAPSR